MTSKHVPLRTCVACHARGDKRRLIRLVRGVDGNVAVDVRGRSPGRGTYLCASIECWRSGILGNCLEHGLRVKLTEEDKARLMTEGCALIGGK